MLPSFWTAWEEAVYERVTVKLIRSFTGWYVMVVDNALQLSIWGQRCPSRVVATDRYNTLVAKYNSGALRG